MENNIYSIGANVTCVKILSKMERIMQICRIIILTVGVGWAPDSRTREFTV